ncbi:Increased rDNA silencing protein 4 [Trichoderma ghanense]|uniref:Increased rDNA silencing protein 4 n=1 Tax=Trichoderma ghanense TaxID=65468 RepID=A0ABY2GUW8_9HYPO
MSDSAAAAAALRGATLAFRRDRVDVEQQRAEGAGRRAFDNGAFTAATEAVRGRAERGRAGGGGGAVTDGRMVQLHSQQQAMGGMAGGGGGITTSSSLLSSAAPGGKMAAKKKSQSLIAATLAASRSASPTGGRAARTDGLASSGGSANISGGLGGDVMDTGPLASAGSLISMFDRARGRPSPPESVASSAEEKVDRTRSKATTTTNTKGRTPGKGEAPPTPPAARTKTRRDPVADAGPDEGSRAPAGDGKPKQRPKPTAAAEYSDISAYPMPTFTSHRQPPPLQHLHQRPTISKEHITAAASSPRLPSSTSRPMTPTSASAVQPSTPASSSDSQARPKSSQTTTTALHPSTPPPLKPLMSRHVAEVLSPQPRRVSRTPLSPVTSPHLALSPGISAALAPPSPDPLKKRRDSAAKRPPTPPKPRGSGKNILDEDQSQDQDKPVFRDRSYSIHTDGSSSGQTRSSGASSASRPTGQSTPLFHQHGETHPSSMALARRGSTMSVPSTPSRELVSHRHAANGSPNRTQLDNLTDAIVAGSLASARLTPHNTGPTSLAPPPLPKRQKSPRLLHTLRQPHNELDEEEDHHKKGHRALLRKGKHAHHEGSRKKWREEIRPRERKRYEALWASNRGILLTDTRVMSPATSLSSDLDRDVSQCVANVVVREVWKRSRLPDDELAEIYDLVDRSKTGMLSRAEFVVGTWLIDQRLKGRKVPAKVTDSVWGSANGVRVKGPHGK